MFNRLEKAGKAFEDALLVVILGGMVLLAAAQIVLRNFFDIGFIWSDELLRLLVLWLAVAGAVAASRKDRHISIAVLDRFLPASVNRFVRVMLDLFSAAVCAIIAWHSLKFVMGSYEYDDRLLGNVPAWVLQSVMPAGFALIAWRYSVFALRGVAGKQRAEPQR